LYELMHALQEWHKRIAALMAAQAKRREEARLEHGASNINTAAAAAAARGDSHNDAATAAAAASAAAAAAAANAPAHESEKHYSETLTAIVEAREKLRRQQAE
jgi:hypothetical protein